MGLMIVVKTLSIRIQHSTAGLELKRAFCYFAGLRAKSNLAEVGERRSGNGLCIPTTTGRNPWFCRYHRVQVFLRDADRFIKILVRRHVSIVHAHEPTVTGEAPPYSAFLNKQREPPPNRRILYVSGCGGRRPKMFHVFEIGHLIPRSSLRNFPEHSRQHRLEFRND
jgi:hypothetical protein